MALTNGVSTLSVRGPEARGCVLDTDQLLAACETVGASLSENSKLLVLSKFGKTEVEGAGFRSPIVRAMELSAPVWLERLRFRLPYPISWIGIHNRPQSYNEYGATRG